MLWMLATCVALAHEKWRLSSVEPEDAVFLWYANIHSAVYSPLTGAGLAGLMLCVWRRLCGGPRFPVQPGHWFLVINGTEHVVFAFWELINSCIVPDDMLGFLPTWFTFSELILFKGFVVAMMFVAACTQSSSAWWRAAFVAMTLNHFSQVLQTTLMTIFSGGAWFMGEFAWSIESRIIYSLPAVFAVLGSIADWRARRAHDFLHWVGVFVIVAQSLIAWPDFVIWRYLFR
jgi:hypothetical protein